MSLLINAKKKKKKKKKKEMAFSYLLGEKISCSAQLSMKKVIFSAIKEKSKVICHNPVNNNTT